MAIAPPYAYSSTTSLRNNLPLLLTKTLTEVVPPLRKVVVRQIAGGPHVTLDDAAKTLESIRGFPLPRAMAQGGIIGSSPEVSALNCPITLVRGTSDRWLCPVRDIRRWRRAIPHAEYIKLPGLPHEPHQHDPHAIASIVLAD